MYLESYNKLKNSNCITTVTVMCLFSTVLAQYCQPNKGKNYVI